MLHFLKMRMQHIALRTRNGADAEAMVELSRETLTLLRDSLARYPLQWGEASALTELFSAESCVLPRDIANQCVDLVAQKMQHSMPGEPVPSAAT